MDPLKGIGTAFDGIVKVNLVQIGNAINVVNTS